MRRVAVAMCLALSACASPYAPEPLEITDAAQFAANREFCRQAAAKFESKPSIGNVAASAISGGTGSISYAPIDPAIPILGAVGAAIRSLAAGLDITGQTRRNVEKNCLRDKTRRDGSAILANPDN